jgi:uncharacterized damage-inducible protein DinB
VKYPTLESRSDLLKMLDELTQARRQVLERCERLAPERRHDPVIPGTWSLLEILVHLARSEEWILAWAARRPFPLPEGERPAAVPPELPAIRTALDEAHAAATAFLKSHPEGVLREPCVYMTFGEQTVGGLFFHLIEHEIHHRAFALYKLAQLEAAG